MIVCACEIDPHMNLILFCYHVFIVVGILIIASTSSKGYLVIDFLWLFLVSVLLVKYSLLNGAGRHSKHHLWINRNGRFVSCLVLCPYLLALLFEWYLILSLLGLKHKKRPVHHILLGDNMVPFPPLQDMISIQMMATLETPSVALCTVDRDIFLLLSFLFHSP